MNFSHARPSKRPCSFLSHFKEVNIQPPFAFPRVSLRSGLFSFAVEDNLALA